ncbi:MAG: response regulator [Gemmatimonadetes bacterium]|nr:response regulator [Gemmatimonadota bacterium]
MGDDAPSEQARWMEKADIEAPLVLIAERDQSVRRLQALFLERAGFVVEFSDDGEQALERALAIRPAVLVTEILIPKLDGLALCRAVRENPLTRDTPIMVFSILGAAQRAAEAGATAFLRKPLVDSIFVAAVQDLIAAQPPRLREKQWASKS